MGSPHKGDSTADDSTDGAAVAIDVPQSTDGGGGNSHLQRSRSITIGILQNTRAKYSGSYDDPHQEHYEHLLAECQSHAKGGKAGAEQEHAPVHVKACLDPGELYHYMAAAGASRSRMTITTEWVLGMLAGAYIGLGFTLCMLVGGQLSASFRTEQPGAFNFLFGAFGFPFGLTLVVVAGANLFTSNIAYFAVAWMEGRVTFLQLLRSWGVSWVSNLVGALLLTQFMVWGEVFEGRSDFTVALAHKKVSHSFGVTLTRGIFCNWLVCLAVWQANAAHDIAGKILAIWLPISAFVAMSFEHCIANQYMIPMSMRLGSDISVGTFLSHNLIPATIGNILGGALFVGTAYACSYGKLGRAVDRQIDLGAQKLRAVLGLSPTAKISK